jgi:hypothetical protein
MRDWVLKSKFCFCKNNKRIIITWFLTGGKSVRFFCRTRPGWAPDPLMVGIRSPVSLVVGSCTSHPGVLGSIPEVKIFL